MIETNMPYQILATYYEQLSETRDWEAWIAYVDAVLRAAEVHRHPNSLILDAACGTGRIAVGLTSLGYRVEGVDASEPMLEQARANAKRSGYEIPLYHQDLRRLDIPQKFQWAISLCDSLNYILDTDDLALAMKNIADHLEPDGYFLFDVNTDWKLENMYGDYTYAEHHDGFSYIWENEYDPVRRVVTMHLSFFVSNETGLYRRWDEVHVQRAHTHVEILEALTEAGLQLVAWGDPFGLIPPEPRRERTFYLARR